MYYLFWTQVFLIFVGTNDRDDDDEKLRQHSMKRVWGLFKNKIKMKTDLFITIIFRMYNESIEWIIKS